MEQFLENSRPFGERYETKDLPFFNTNEYWWCYYDKEKDYILNQYGSLVNKSAKEYLLKKGLIDSDGNILKRHDFNDTTTN